MMGCGGEVGGRGKEGYSSELIAGAWVLTMGNRS